MNGMRILITNNTYMSLSRLIDEIENKLLTKNKNYGKRNITEIIRCNS